ncbi:hypothetical protein A6V37_05965 [Paraburkholderia ginsengiterrae]|uniref:DUF2459 domain-containing protein n=2 Tax=Paraburkholderia ginsengiterrae TaxID=1462993 RepID=A0A1A9N1J9_9BURK|nr:hypothetical protein A6V37_05965 [Paraburkholderia ginsengiterrae]
MQKRRSLHCSRTRAVVARAAIAASLAACASAPPMPSSVPGDATGLTAPTATTIEVVERDWHTDICIRSEDMDTSLARVARDFAGARFFCFGFGERQYVVGRRHDPLTMIAALLPSKAALLMAALRAPPAEAFGAANVVRLAINAAGRDGLQTYLRESLETDPNGQPVILGAGPYPGSVFYAAVGTYDAFHTCNTWTARALRSARLPVDDTVLFAGAVMRQARQLAGVTGTPDAAAGSP